MTIVSDSAQTWASDSLRDDAAFVDPDPIVHPARITIQHFQLRDLVHVGSYPHQIVYPCEDSVIQYSTKHRLKSLLLKDLGYMPACINTGYGFIAAGGQRGQLTVRDRDGTWLHSLKTSSHINNSLQFYKHIDGSIRLLVSGNDRTVKVYKMPNLRSQDRYILQDLGIEKVATLRADININYASPSPDGRTLLVVGDTNEVFLYDMRLGGQLEYREMGVVYASPSPSLSAAWAPNSRVFAVAGQEGLVSVFDVRMMGGDRPRRGKESQSPTMLYQFGPNGDRRRLPRNISHSSFISTDHSEPDMMYPFLYGRSGHGLYSISSAADFSFSASRSSPSSLSSSSASSRGNSGAHRSTLFTGGSMGHGSSHGLQERDKHALRVVKFSQSGVLDLMAYSEHATHVHIIDARTFQSRQTLRVCPPGIDSHITGLCFNFDDGQEDGPGPNEPWADMGGEKLLVGLENSVLEYSIKDTSRRSFAIGDMA